jgi:beta-phosphoglucomutase
MRVTNSMFRGVVFDLDGVIVDSHSLHKRAWREFLAYVGKEVSNLDLAFIFEGRRRREILIHFLGVLSDSEIHEYGKKKDDFFRQASNDLKPVDGSIEFIKTLEKTGFRLGLASSASRQRALWTLQELKVADCFEVVVTGDDVAKGKPDPSLYRLAAAGLSISPKLLFAVEDSVSGVLSAKAAGFHCIGIAPAENGGPLIQAGAGCVVANLMNLSIPDLEELFNRSSCSAQGANFLAVSE